MHLYYSATVESQMAAIRLNSRERADIYRRIFMLNRSFDLIVQRLDELAHVRIFSRRDLREMCGPVQEVQLEINQMLLDKLHYAEERDWTHFGNLRAALEKRLRGKS